MKRLLAFGLVAFAGAGAAGCPVYSDNIDCVDAVDCPGHLVCSRSGYCVEPNYGGAGYGGTGGGGAGGARDGGAEEASADAQHDGAAHDAAATDSAGDAPRADGALSVSCGNPNDCAATETCASDGTCRAGDCQKNGCVNQFECAASGQGVA